MMLLIHSVKCTLATLSCVYSEIKFTIIPYFQNWNKSGGLENFSKINKRGGGDDYSVLESKRLAMKQMLKMSKMFSS